MRLWLLRICALLAGAISAYLFALSMGDATAGGPAGCSAEGGCGDVLGSQWSKVLGVPVSLPAVVLYAAVLLVSFQRGQAWARWTLTACAAVVLGAAAWFVTLQLAVLGKLCVYCMAAHGLGTVMALLALTLPPPPSGALSLLKPPPEDPKRGRRSGSPVLRHTAAVFVGLLAAGGLVAAQLLYAPPPRPVHPLRAAFVRNLDPARYPTLGQPDPANQDQVAIAYLYDVNCPACRLLHRHLRAARQRYGERLVVAMMPVVFHPQCNAHVSRVYEGFDTSCELQRLAVAVHLADATRFEAFDAYLFDAGTAPAPSEARAYAVSLVGEEALDAALVDAEVDAMLARHAELFNAVGKSVPRLIVAERVYPPLADEASLFALLESLTPLESPDPAEPHEPETD